MRLRLRKYIDLNMPSLGTRVKAAQQKFVSRLLSQRENIVNDPFLDIWKISLAVQTKGAKYLERLIKVKKVKVGFFYSATYTGNAATSRAVQAQEVAVDWQEPVVQERNAAATTHTTAPINHTRPSPRKHSPDVAARVWKHTSDYSLLLSLSTSKGWKAELTWGLSDLCVLVMLSNTIWHRGTILC